MKKIFISAEFVGKKVNCRCQSIFSHGFYCDGYVQIRSSHDKQFLEQSTCNNILCRTRYKIIVFEPIIDTRKNK